MHRRIRSALVVSMLAATLLVAAPPAAQAAPCTSGETATFSDVPLTHPFCEEIYAAAAEGLVTGTLFGTFGPGNPVTRAQVAAIITRWSLVGEPPVGCSGPPATDVPVTHPLCAEIQFAMSGDAMSGYLDGSFRPSQTLTRQQAAAVFARGLPEDLEDCTSAPFPDVPASHQFCPEITAAAHAGIVTGYSDGTFRPTGLITRGAFAAMFWRFFVYLEDPVPE
jgi:endo-1,4-beta-xylanase